jgi:hypothetical protein
MTSEQKDPLLRVGCPCGKWLPVQESDAGRSIGCSSCGRRLEVPLLEEFQEKPDLISCGTVEDRIGMLISAGEIPRVGKCGHCGEYTNSVIDAKLDCERYTAHHEGGMRFIYIPGLFWATWHEKETVEIHGHDTVVPAPLCLCTECQIKLRAPTSKFCIVLAVFLVLATLALFLHYIAALALVVVGIVATALTRRGEVRARQRVLKGILGQTPVYRQMLKSYPYAIVVFPPTE